MNITYPLKILKNLKFHSLFKPVSASSLGLFRLLFGLILVWQTFCGFNSSFLEENFLKAHYHFPFRLFEILHLKYLPPAFFDFCFLILGAAGLLIFAGVFFRAAAAVFFLGFLYIFLSEKSLYNDYYYLILLLTFLLTFTGADRWPALPTLRHKKHADALVPFWQIFILRLQFVIIYFYAAVSKISVDWLIQAQPLRNILAAKSIFGFSGNSLALAYLLSWGGFLLDLALAILLLLGRWRPLAYAGILLFNLINLWLFNDIEAFPFLMIAGLTLFLNPDTPEHVTRKVENFLRISGRQPPPPPPTAIPAPTPQKKSRWHEEIVAGFIGVYLMIQILVPLRHFLYPGNTSWTYEGSRFAWRLKINAKDVKLKVRVTDPAAGRSFEVPYQNLLTPQQTWLDNVPDMLLLYAHALREELKQAGIANPIIRVEGTAKFNDRPRQPYIDGQVNLAEEEYPLFSQARWIIPLKE